MEESLTTELQTFLDEFEVLDNQEFWTFPGVTEHIDEALAMTATPTSSFDTFPISAYDQQQEGQSSGKKRKNEHVLDLINQYANELQKKRKQEEADLAEQVAQEKRRAKMDIFDRMMDSFNTGDFNHMSEIVRTHCADNVLLKTPIVSKECRGVASVLVFWGLLHETYPDAMTKILEKRVSSAAASPALSQGRSESMEYVYKFAGTRIVSKPVAESFNEVLGVIATEHITKQDEISAAISRQMTSISPALYQESECSFIAETVLTFDAEDKIVEWAYDILAAEII